MKIELAKLIFHTNLTVMKKVLDLAEFKLGKGSDEYKYFKSQIMDYFYINLSNLFKTLLDAKLLFKCECGASIRKGYSDCPQCGGSGFRI